MIIKKLLLIFFIICLVIIIAFFHLFNIQKMDNLEIKLDKNVKFYKVKRINSSFFDLYQINKSFGQSAYGLASADFNNDGLLDFVASYATSPFNYSTVSLFINKDNLSFEQHDLFSLNYSYIKDLEAADFDNDGDIDLVFSFDEYRWYDDLPFNMNGTLVLARNNGVNDFLNLSLIYQWTSEDKMDTNRRINLQLTSVDYDNDGDIDIVVGDNSGKVELLLNQGNGSFYSNGVFYDFGKLSWGVASMDINNDNNIDIIVAAASEETLYSNPGNLYYIPNDGAFDGFKNDNFLLLANISSLPGTGCLLPIDIDSDSHKEIILGMDDKLIVYSLNSSKNVNKREPICIAEFNNYSTNFYEEFTKGGMAIGDFNNDGYVDFITGGVKGIIRLFVNNEKSKI